MNLFDADPAITYAPVAAKEKPKALAPLVMIDDKGRQTKKVQDCWRWTRMERGFGWHAPREKPVPRC